MLGGGGVLINSTILFKSINTYVNTFILLVFYIVALCLYFFSTIIFNQNVSHTIYFGVRLHCPVRFYTFYGIQDCFQKVTKTVYHFACNN